MPPRRIELTQGTEEWLAYREGGIGASEAAVILFESPFQKPYNLWLLKCGMAKPKATRPAMQHGIDHEDTARQQLATELGFPIEPAIFESADADYIRASLDGWSGEHRLPVEIKCPMTDHDHRSAREGHIPYYYWIQVQHQLAVTEAERAIYYSWYKGDGVQIPIEFDADFWFGKLLPAEQEFWRRVTERVWPTPDGVIQDDSPGFARNVEKLVEARHLMRVAENEKRLAEADILRRLGDSRRIVGAGFRAYCVVYQPKYYVQVECADEQVQAMVLEALQKQVGKRAGIRKISPSTWDARIDYRFEEE